MTDQDWAEFEKNCQRSGESVTQKLEGSLTTSSFFTENKFNRKRDFKAEILTRTEEKHWYLKMREERKIDFAKVKTEVDPSNPPHSSCIFRLYLLPSERRLRNALSSVWENEPNDLTYVDIRIDWCVSSANEPLIHSATDKASALLFGHNLHCFQAPFSTIATYAAYSAQQYTQVSRIMNCKNYAHVFEQTLIREVPMVYRSPDTSSILIECILWCLIASTEFATVQVTLAILLLFASESLRCGVVLLTNKSLTEYCECVLKLIEKFFPNMGGAEKKRYNMSRHAALIKTLVAALVLASLADYRLIFMAFCFIHVTNVSTNVLLSASRKSTWHDNMTLFCFPLMPVLLFTLPAFAVALAPPFLFLTASFVVAGFRNFKLVASLILQSLLSVGCIWAVAVAEHRNLTELRLAFVAANLLEDISIVESIYLSYQQSRYSSMNKSLCQPESNAIVKFSKLAMHCFDSTLSLLSIAFNCVTLAFSSIYSNCGWLVILTIAVRIVDFWNVHGLLLLAVQNVNKLGSKVRNHWRASTTNCDGMIEMLLSELKLQQPNVDAHKSRKIGVSFFRSVEPGGVVEPVRFEIVHAEQESQFAEISVDWPAEAHPSIDFNHMQSQEGFEYADFHLETTLHNLINLGTLIHVASMRYGVSRMSFQCMFEAALFELDKVGRTGDLQELNCVKLVPKILGVMTRMTIVLIFKSKEDFQTFHDLPT